MKYLSLLGLSLIVALSSYAQTGKAETVYNKKSQTTSVSVNIHSDANTIWAILTNGSEYPSWNSTVVRISGNIALGERIELTSKLNEKKAYKLKVTELSTTRMVWSDGKGGRIFSLEKVAQGMKFTMSETIGGFMYPMYKKHLPDFNASFEAFAADLKRAAEIKNHHH